MKIFRAVEKGMDIPEDLNELPDPDAPALPAPEETKAEEEPKTEADEQ